MSLLSIQGFNERYEFYLPGAQTNEAAYERVEKEFKEAFNHRKYANFHSFRNARMEWLKRSRICKTR